MSKETFIDILCFGAFIFGFLLGWYSNKITNKKLDDGKTNHVDRRTNKGTGKRDN